MSVTSPVNASRRRPSTAQSGGAPHSRKGSNSPPRGGSQSISGNADKKDVSPSASSRRACKSDASTTESSSSHRHLRRGEGHLASDGKRGSPYDRGKHAKATNSSCASSTTVSHAASVVTSTACSRAPSQPSSMPASRIASPSISTACSRAPSPPASRPPSRPPSPHRTPATPPCASPTSTRSRRLTPKGAGGRAAESMAKVFHQSGIHRPRQSFKGQGSETHRADGRRKGARSLGHLPDALGASAGSALDEGDADISPLFSARSFVFNSDGTCKALQNMQGGLELEDGLRRLHDPTHDALQHVLLPGSAGQASATEAWPQTSRSDLEGSEVDKDSNLADRICSVYDVLEQRLSALLEVDENEPSGMGATSSKACSGSAATQESAASLVDALCSSSSRLAATHTVLAPEVAQGATAPPVVVVKRAVAVRAAPVLVRVEPPALTSSLPSSPAASLRAPVAMISSPTSSLRVPVATISGEPRPADQLSLSRSSSARRLTPMVKPVVVTPMSRLSSQRPSSPQPNPVAVQVQFPARPGSVAIGPPRRSQGAATPQRS